MTTDDDIALKDLVSQTLDARGILPKIRAELRANVFLALEETPDFKKLTNNELTEFAKTDNGCLALNLIREFLTFYNLDFTLSVFNPESRFSIDYSEMRRLELMKKLNLTGNDSTPLLCQFLNRNKTGLAAFENSSPVGLNSTYTKNEEILVKNTPVDEEDEEPYSVATESISEASIKDEESGRNTPEQQNESINLLMFTPVQQVRTVPKEKTENDRLETPGPKKGILSDLPPLTPVGTKKTISEIRKNLEEGFPEDSNHSSKNSENSDETIQDDDINDILNSNDSDSKATADETVSQISTLDHMESV